MKRLFILAVAAILPACTTLSTVRLTTDKAFLTAQLALKSAQQTTLAICSVPEAPKDPCAKAVDILHTGAQAEAAGFTAQQAGNASDLKTAIQTLNDLPSQLAALGLLEGDE